MNLFKIKTFSQRISKGLAFACIAACMSTMAFSQSKSIKGVVIKEQIKTEDISMSVTIDSAEDLEATFNLEDLKEIFDMSSPNQTVSFKLICNGEKMSNGIKSSVSYKVDGNSNQPEEFLKSVETIRDAAIKYYKNKQE